MENRDGSRKQIAKAVLKASDNLLCNRNLARARARACVCVCVCVCVVCVGVCGRKTSLRRQRQSSQSKRGRTLKGTRETEAKAETEVDERDTLDIKRGGGSHGEETPPRRDQGCKVAPMTQSPAAASGDI
ncbi:hypothetical protein ALC53_00277 [Atta colombica]|uniref:Uncharacterized protein n=1 Tax=Atta colombica TaxID=520822 RepID=A0A195BYF6_9HYME|nr:hypothetical protein ALC53_00277 [Atta colombica]